ncbi:unnamed protein product [Brassicogethes aeneus]|uniref:Pseudouridine synthase I TruA alpha/beta domain-containing protein n=1 Tax=Brassicogethes aeneus TaxID=1431903 RepID=A0A9P0FMJ3_BRAAE|nr:unnamed protein product [Brassicogethes aeneus]
MDNVKIKKPTSTENLENLSKEELINMVKSLEAHNNQLKNIIAKLSGGESSKYKNNSYDFSKCHFRHILLKFFYLGWDYNGYAVQEDTSVTIENYIFKSLTKTCLIKDRQSSNYHRCGRTDKGVSSFGQTISIDVRSKLTKETEENVEDELDYCQMLNSVLPDNIQCVAWSPIENNFSARFDCNSRIYRYFFAKGWLNIEAMMEASQFLIGTHDYRHFCKMDVGNGVVQFIRRIDEINIKPSDLNENENEYSMYVITIKGKAFLWHQIRCIMGILFLIGQNKEKPHIVKELLDIKKNPRKPEYQMASEIPLNLYFCDYDTNNWVYSIDSLTKCIKKLKNAWTFTGAKGSMIKTMILSLEDNLKTISEKNDKTLEKNCLSEYLIQGVKMKNYIPLMKRQKCKTLEERIKHFTKRKRIEIVKE